jgi:hypothetical protein
MLRWELSIASSGRDSELWLPNHVSTADLQAGYEMDEHRGVQETVKGDRGVQIE